MQIKFACNIACNPPQQAKMNLIASRLQEIANSQFADDEAAMWEELEP